MAARRTLGSLLIPCGFLAGRCERVARRLPLRTLDLSTRQRPLRLVQLHPVRLLPVDAPAHRGSPHLAQHLGQGPGFVTRTQVRKTRQQHPPQTSPQEPVPLGLPLGLDGGDLGRFGAALGLEIPRNIHLEQGRHHLPVQLRVIPLHPLTLPRHLRVPVVHPPVPRDGLVQSQLLGCSHSVDLVLAVHAGDAGRPPG